MNEKFLDYVRQLKCLVYEDFGYECDGPVQPHHVRSRGASGAEADNIVPLCHRHHRLCHDSGRLTFQQKYHTNFKMLAHDIYFIYCQGL